MNRRSFLQRTASLGVGTAALASPALAQQQPDLEWRITSSFPKSLGTIYGAAETFADYVAAATDNRFRIQVFASGEIVPGLQALDAVRTGAVEMCHTASYYFWGKDPTFAFGTAVPFGLNARQQNAWNYHGGGIDLMNAFYGTYNIHGLPCGNTGTQMGGWFRREVTALSDLKGLRMRIGGIGGRILSRLGVEPRQMAGEAIYEAFENGELDAAEWVGPHDDETLGLHKVAPNYYYPGFWEGGATLHLFINRENWDALPASYKAVVRTAAQAVNADMLAQYDYENPAAIRSLVSKGATLRAFPEEVLQAAFEAAEQTYLALRSENASFETVHDSIMAFRKDAYLWAGIAEQGFDRFMLAQQSAGKL